MVETAIYVALGALTSALLALLALPAVSRRAFRLAEARLRLAGPLTAEQAQADRDALRGRHAIEITLVERRAEAAETRWAKAEAALGRNLAAAQRLETALAEQTAQAADLAARLAESEREVQGRDVEIAAREQAMRDCLAQRDAATAERDLWREQFARRVEEAERTEAQLAARLAQMTAELGAVRGDTEATLAGAGQRVIDLEQRLAISEADAARLKRHATELTERFRGRLSEAWDRRNELSLRVAALTQANAEAETSLRAARAERDAAQREAARLAEAAASQSEGDERLRQTLARIGRELAAAPPPKLAPVSHEAVERADVAAR